MALIIGQFNDVPTSAGARRQRDEPGHQPRCRLRTTTAGTAPILTCPAIRGVGCPILAFQPASSSPEARRPSSGRPFRRSLPWRRRGMSSDAARPDWRQQHAHRLQTATCPTMPPQQMARDRHSSPTYVLPLCRHSTLDVRRTDPLTAQRVQQTLRPCLSPFWPYASQPSHLCLPFHLWSWSSAPT